MRRPGQLIGELVKDLSVFDVFLYANDYHNLKAAIKEARMDSEYPGIYIDQGTVDVKRIREAVRTRDFAALPEAMAEPAKEAYEVLLQTGDGQLCDIIIDRQALNAIYQAGKAVGDECLKLYGELTVASADIKTGGARCAYRQGQSIFGAGSGPLRHAGREPSGPGSGGGRGRHLRISGTHALRGGGGGASQVALGLRAVV